VTRQDRIRRRVGNAIDWATAVALLVSVFVLTAAVAGLWVGMVLRFVWITAP